jgi:hypothetical protein
MENNQENQENVAQNTGDQNPKGWMDLLRRYISKAPKKVKKSKKKKQQKYF